MDSSQQPYSALGSRAICANCIISASFPPGHDRHGADRILGGAFDEPVRVAQVHQRIVGLVVEPHHMELLEQERAALVEHLLLVLQLALEADWPDLPAGDGGVGG